MQTTVGHIPLEVNKLCHYFIVHRGQISGIFDDTKPRRSPIPSGGLAIKLRLTFKGVALLTDRMKVLLRRAYDYEYDGEQEDQETAEKEQLELLDDAVL